MFSPISRKMVTSVKILYLIVKGVFGDHLVPLWVLVSAQGRVI